MHPIFDVLEKEKEDKVLNGLYKSIQIELSYNSNKIEGSTITLLDAETIYEKNVIYPSINTILVDDIQETKNHFKLFDFMLSTINEPLSERLIQEYQQILKMNTDYKEKYGSGKYKTIPNRVGNIITAEPHKVHEEMKRLIDDYSNKETILIEDILLFHIKFERIHPFQDGNGRVGRIIMFRECLKNNIDPFIIKDENKRKYYHSLNEYEQSENIIKFIEYIEEEQLYMRNISDPFLNHYNKKM